MSSSYARDALRTGTRYISSLYSTRLVSPGLVSHFHAVETEQGMELWYGKNHWDYENSYGERERDVGLGISVEV